MTSMYGVGGWRNRGVEVGCVGCEIMRLVNVAALKPAIAWRRLSHARPARAGHAEASTGPSCGRSRMVDLSLGVRNLKTTSRACEHAQPRLID